MAFFIAFSKKLLENHFFKEQCSEQIKCVFDNTKLPTENISICCFSAATQGLVLRRILII